MTLRLVDPTIGLSDQVFPRAPRLHSLDGVRLGLVDNNKTHGDVILHRIVESLERRHRLGDVLHRRKPQYSMPLEEPDVDSLAEECGAILAAVGD